MTDKIDHVAHAASDKQPERPAGWMLKALTVLWRSGVVDRANSPDSASITSKPPEFAITILDEFTAPCSASDELIIEAVYDQIRGGPHAKRTFPNRYERINAALADQCFAADEKIYRIHDMAASNGITSIEMFKSLGERHHVHASDYFDVVKVVKIGKWQIIFDVENNIIQYVGPRQVISTHKRKSLFNRIKLWVLTSELSAQAISLLGQGNYRSIQLFHPLALELSKKNSLFTLGHDNLFEPAPNSYDIVTILSAFAGYPDEKIKNAIGKIAETIVPGGFLVIGRNRGRGIDSIPTSFFRRIENRLVVHHEIDGGSELSALVLGASTDPLK